MNITIRMATIVTIVLLIVLMSLGNDAKYAQSMIPVTEALESERWQADVRTRHLAMRVMVVAGATMAVLIAAAMSFTMIHAALNLTKAKPMRKPGSSERLEDSVAVQRNAIDAVALALHQLPPIELSQGDRAFIEWYDRDSNSS